MEVTALQATRNALWELHSTVLGGFSDKSGATFQANPPRNKPIAYPEHLWGQVDDECASAPILWIDLCMPCLMDMKMFSKNIVYNRTGSMI